MKEKLNELVQALIKDDSKAAKEALHEYLTQKTRAILAEADIVILDDDDDDDYEGDMDGEEGDVDLDLDGEEGDDELDLDGEEGDVDLDVEDDEIGDKLKRLR